MIRITATKTTARVTAYQKSLRVIVAMVYLPGAADLLRPVIVGVK